MSASVRLGKNEFISIGLGLISWIFPNIPTPVKIVITLLVIAIIIFLLLEKSQKQRVMNSTDKAFNYYIIPGLAGGLKFFYFALLGFWMISLITAILFNKSNLFTSVDPFQNGYGKTGVAKGWIATLWDIVTHLNTAGYILAVIVSIVGMTISIKKNAKSRKTT